MKIQIPKGVFDILPYPVCEKWHLSSYWQYVEKILIQTSQQYGYREIRTPIFEKTELFEKSVGQTSDIVTKEMYTFEDKSNRSLTLKPEGTSCILRAFVEKSFHQFSSVHKLFYISPMFRYERPQSGRYRQHHQFGVEAIGISSYEQDAEVIDLLLECYRRLGLKNLDLQLNSIGDQPSRDTYKQAFKKYLTPFFDELSEDSQGRFEKNPLRILDSKNTKDQEILKKAPSILDCLSPSSKDHFDKLCGLLKNIGIDFQINPKIVRGLDYYNHTVFEVTCPELGAQNSIGGGGRYDGFTQTFGGPSLPGIGFGSGIERVLQAMICQNVFFPDMTPTFIYLIPLDASAKEFCFQLTSSLRHASIPSEIDLKVKKIHTSLQKASQLKASYCLIIGSDELAQKTATLKNMQKKEESRIAFDQLFDEIKRLWEQQ